MTERKKAYAYDPIRNEDVPIDCNPMHQSTDFDDIDGDELPVLIESDFKHDPVEACQGSFSEIVEMEEGCPNCGYDRATHTGHTLAGVHREKCRACGADVTDRHRDDFEPSAPTDHLERIRRHSEYVGKTNYRSTKVYVRDENTSLLNLVRGDSTFALSRRDFVSLARIILGTYDREDDPLSKRDAQKLLRDTIRVAEEPEDEEADE